MAHTRLRCSPAWQLAELAQVNCATCVALESIRFQRIVRYVEAVQKRKGSVVEGYRAPDGCEDEVSRAEQELNEIWRRLSEHRAVHTR